LAEPTPQTTRDLSVSSIHLGPNSTPRRTIDDPVARSRGTFVRARRRWGIAALAAIALSVGSIGCFSEPGESDAPTKQEFVVRSRQYTVDAIFRSMKGPQGKQAIFLGDLKKKPELIWITGYKTKIIDPETGERVSDEFMCHSNLGIHNMDRHAQIFGAQPPGRSRLFTLSQGTMDVEFPKGFGIPILSNEKLALVTQVLNLNPQPAPVEVQHETTIEYVKDADLKQPMKALFQVGAQAMVLLEGENPYYGVSEPDPEIHGEGCLLGEPAGELEHKDSSDQTFLGHWVVPPGRQENHSLVTHWLALREDTTIHAIAVHLHPFAESLALRDLTTGETVYKAIARGPKESIGLNHVDFFASPEGIPIYKDHQYEVVSVYDNVSGVDQDAMAIMFLYMHDPGFVKPSL